MATPAALSKVERPGTRIARPTKSAAPAPNDDKRKRTHDLLMRAALRVYAQKGLDAPIADFITEAGVSRGTFYNYFSTREEIMDAVATELANYVNSKTRPLCEMTSDLIEPVAISARYFVRLAGEDRIRASVLARMMLLKGPLTTEMRKGSRARVRRAVDAGLLNVASVPAAVDLTVGMMASAIQHNLSNTRNRYAPELVATMILQALGCPPAQAQEIAHRPLPVSDDFQQITLIAAPPAAEPQGRKARSAAGAPSVPSAEARPVAPRARRANRKASATPEGAAI